VLEHFRIRILGKRLNILCYRTKGGTGEKSKFSNSDVENSFGELSRTLGRISKGLTVKTNPVLRNAVPFMGVKPRRGSLMCGGGTYIDYFSR